MLKNVVQKLAREYSDRKSAQKRAVIFVDGDNIKTGVLATQNLVGLIYETIFFYTQESVLDGMASMTPSWDTSCILCRSSTRLKDATDATMVSAIALLNMLLPTDVEFVVVTSDQIANAAVHMCWENRPAIWAQNTQEMVAHFLIYYPEHALPLNLLKTTNGSLPCLTWSYEDALYEVWDRTPQEFAVKYKVEMATLTQFLKGECPRYSQGDRKVRAAIADARSDLLDLYSDSYIGFSVKAIVQSDRWATQSEEERARILFKKHWTTSNSVFIKRYGLDATQFPQWVEGQLSDRHSALAVYTWIMGEKEKYTHLLQPKPLSELAQNIYTWEDSLGDEEIFFICDD